jgi:hypothetical protein
MRRVNFEAQERVDLPDMTAVSSLMLGEFRRQLRGLVLGESANKIVKGFAVEPAGVPDTTITVKLDDGGSLGFFIGSQDLGSRIDYGQLAGGDDIAGNLEGAAQIILDFTGQPADTYNVDVRFVEVDGTADNRVFRNEVTEAEFIASTETRVLPLYQLRDFGDPVTGDYQTLAAVIWNGVSIDANDITDDRVFLFEGDDFEAPLPGDPGGMPDFPRGKDRELVDAGVNEVYPILRALGRQIQDMKGPDPLTGQWNWFGRTRGITDPFGTIGAPEFTTSFTHESEQVFTVGVGNGITGTTGHFNGPGGLQNCLNHIATIADGVNVDDTYPGRFKIILKPGINQDTAFWTCPTPINLVNAHLEICVAGQGGLDSGLNGSIYGMVPIDFTHPAGTPFFTITGGTLKLKDIRTDAPINELVEGTLLQLEIEHCLFLFNDVASIYNDWKTKLTDTSIQGGTITLTKSGLADIWTSELKGCHFARYNSNLFQLRLWDDEMGTVAAAAADSAMERLLIDQCQFNDHAEQATASFPAMIDARGARDITITNCDIEVPSSQDFLLVGQIDTAPGAGQGTRGITIRDSSVTGRTAVTHAVGAGFNGVKGTGWTVFCDQIDTLNTSRSVTLDNCTWHDYQGTDAGGVYSRGTRGLKVNNCDFLKVSMTAAAGTRWAAVNIGTFSTISNARINNILVTGVEGTANRGWCGVRIEGSAEDTKITNSTFECRNEALVGYDLNNSGGLGHGAGIIAYGPGGAGNVGHVSILGNTFTDFDANAQNMAIYVECDNTLGMVVNNNLFDRCSYGMYLFVNINMKITASGNVHRVVQGDVLLAGAGWNDNIYDSYLTLIGNRIEYINVPGAAWEWIDMLTASNYQVFGNDGGPWARLNGVVAVRGRGYSEAQDVNYFAGYV